MGVVSSELKDFNAWIALVRDVEHLFGPMADEVSFQDGLQQAILHKAAFCICSEHNEVTQELKGGIVTSKKTNGIEWLAVSEKYRGQGYDKELLCYAINQFDLQSDIYVQTFNESITEDKAARQLYVNFGFKDYKPGGGEGGAENCGVFFVNKIHRSKNFSDRRENSPYGIKERPNNQIRNKNLRPRIDSRRI